MTNTVWLRDGELRVVAYGLPRPQGSMTAFYNKHTGRAHVKGSDVNRTWRAIVSGAAREAMGGAFRAFPEMVSLEVDFYFRPPQSMPKWRRKFAQKWNGSDLDKLVRSVGDALTDAGVYHDDRQIQYIQAAKWYTSGAPYVEILVTGRSLERG